MSTLPTLGNASALGISATKTTKCHVLQSVDVSTKLVLAHGVVCGMEFLHSQPHPVIHGELKMENVLVGIGPVAKVCENQTINCHFGSINNHFLRRTKF